MVASAEIWKVSDTVINEISRILTLAKAELAKLKRCRMINRERSYFRVDICSAAIRWFLADVLTIGIRPGSWDSGVDAKLRFVPRLDFGVVIVVNKGTTVVRRCLGSCRVPNIDVVFALRWD